MLGLKLEKRRRAAAEGLDADHPAALGARPQVRRDHARHVGRAATQDGDTIPLAAATPTPVEFDEFVNMFDDDTRAAAQQNLRGFGDALRRPRREPQHRRSARCRRCCATSIPVAQNLSTPRHGPAALLRRARRRRARSSRRPPRRRPSCSSNLDTTFGALDAGRAAVHPGLDHRGAARRSTPRSRRSRSSGRSCATPSGLFRELRPGVRALRGAAPDLADALERRHARRCARTPAVQPPPRVAAARGRDVRRRTRWCRAASAR